MLIGPSNDAFLVGPLDLIKLDHGGRRTTSEQLAELLGLVEVVLSVVVLGSRVGRDNGFGSGAARSRDAIGVEERRLGEGGDGEVGGVL